jgi:RNA polymerase sigma-70 factor (ECF subfamily)
MNPTTSEVERAAAGDESALGRLFAMYRDRLRRLVALRLDARLQGRVDASDIIQEGYLDATQRLPAYLADPDRMPFYLWLRFLVAQRVAEAHRRHLGARGRDAGREVALYRGAMPEASTAALAAQLLGKLTSPSQAAIRAERRIRLQEALNAMDPIDREILVLRHYEQLTNGEVATVLGLDKSAASKRYIRALVRLKEALGDAEAPGAGGGE